MEKNTVDLSLSLKNYEPETYIESLDKDIFSIIIENFTIDNNMFSFNYMLHVYFLRICCILFENTLRRNMLFHWRKEYFRINNRQIRIGEDKTIISGDFDGSGWTKGIEGEDGDGEAEAEINLNDILFENYFYDSTFKVHKKVKFDYTFLVHFYDTTPNEREITSELEKTNRKLVNTLHHLIGKDTTLYYRWHHIEIINLLMSYLYS